jgi:hypothetical protein
VKKVTFGWFLTGSSLLFACQAVMDGPPTEAPGVAGGAGSAMAAGAGGTLAGGGGGLAPGSGGSTGGSGGSGGSTTGSGGSTGPGGAAAGSGTGGMPNTGGTGTVGTGPLCDALALLRQKCQSCHSRPPTAGAPMALTTYADLVAPSLGDPSVSMVQMCIQRMQGMGARMPPAPGTPATAADVQVLQAWIDAGEPSTCDAGAAGGGGTGGTGETGGTGGTGGSAGAVGNPYDTPLVCTSNQRWTGGNNESPNMHPGGACINCHSSGEGPRFTFAGTVFPSAHEPDDCNGVNGSSPAAQVIVTDANNATFTMTVNSVGNFSYSGRTAPVMPYTAKVVRGGNERIMTAQQTTGDCNSCHTQDGANDAPGRIMAP